MSLEINNYKSEGLQILEKNSYSPVKIDDILNYISVKYDNSTDTFLINIDSNLVIQGNNIALSSSKDIVLISGEMQNRSGKIYLNPILQKFKKFTDFFIK